MKKLIYSAVLLFAFASVIPAVAQQDPLISQYNQTSLNYNPAFAGLDGNGRLGVLYRKQWLGSGDNSLNTQVASLNAPISSIHSGVGINMVRDVRGPLTNLDFAASYAYHLTLSKGLLSLGARFGYDTRSYDVSNLRPNDLNDPNIPTANVTASTPDLGLGAYFKAEKYFVGLSVAHLVAGKYDLGNAGVRDPYVPNFYLTGGYTFDINPDWTLTPTALLRATSLKKSPDGTYSQVQFDVNATAAYQNRFWIGAGYRQGGGPLALVGASFMKDNALRVYYSIDLSTPSNAVKSLTSHEISASYALNIGNLPPKPIIRTPRYRK